MAKKKKGNEKRSGIIMKNLFENWRGYLKEEILTLYHRTQPETAEQILKIGGFTSKIKTNRGEEIYFSDTIEGEGVDYGSGVVKVEIPEEYAELDDEFPSGERHYMVTVGNLNKYGEIKK
jgi:hypothetical protein